MAASCGGPRTVTVEEYGLTELTLPNGKKIKVETMRDRVELMRGMMFRDSLAEDRGMLFLHGEDGRFSYWMYQVRIPLDMIWINRKREIVEIVHRAPPCSATNSSECPTYGGKQDAMFVLELAGGVAAKHGLKVGDRLSW